MTGKPIILLVLFLAVAFGGFVSASTPMGEVQVLALAPSNPKIAAVLIGQTVWMTFDRGKGWQVTARLSGYGMAREKEPITDFVDEAGTEPAAPEETQSEQADPERRIGWNTALPVQITDPEDIPNRSEPAVLAVGDQGTFAVWLKGHLFFGGPGPGIRRRIQLQGVKGLVIDPEQRLWVVKKNTLLLFGSGSGHLGSANRFSIPGAGAPRLHRIGADGPWQILVSGREGLWVVSLGSPDKKPGLRLEKGPKVDAVVGVPGNGDLYLVSLGRLRKQTGHTQKTHALEDLGPIPAPVEQLVVDGGGRVWLFSRGVGWFEKKSRGVRPIPARSLATDSLGQVWTGTSTGPVTPDERPALLGVVALPENYVSTLNGAQLNRFPGPPRCYRFPLNPLPRLRAFFNFGQGAALHVEPETLQNRKQAETWIYIGIQLTWSFLPALASSCLARQKRWHAQKESQARKIESLWKAWQKAATTQMFAQTPAQALQGKTDREQLEELIQTISGTYPKKEEK